MNVRVEYIKIINLEKLVSFEYVEREKNDYETVKCSN